jgi:hypothetical protein
VRVAALVLTVALTASLLGAEPSARAATAAACGPTQRERLERATGKANIYVPGTATPICGVVLDEHRDPHAVVAAPDGTVYVAERAELYYAGETDAGAVLAFSPTGTRLRRIVHGIANPAAMAVAPDGTLYVLSNGEVINRGTSVHVAAHVGVYPPGATAPSATYPLAERLLTNLALTPNGELLLGTYDGTRILRLRARDGAKLEGFVRPHASDDLRLAALRAQPNGMPAALYRAQSDSPALLMTWSGPNAAQTIQVEHAGDMDVAPDGSLVVIVPWRSIEADVFAPQPLRETLRFTVEGTAYRVTVGRDGNAYFGGRGVLAYDLRGNAVSSLAADPLGPLVLADAARTTAPLTRETPSPSLATPSPPNLADVRSRVASARGIAFDRVHILGLPTEPRLDVSWEEAVALARSSDGDVIHVALLGPYMRVQSERSGTATIVDCAHRTVTTLDLAKHTARYAVAAADLGPRPTPEPGTAAYAAAIPLKPHIVVSPRPRVEIDGTLRAAYHVDALLEVAKQAAAGELRTRRIASTDLVYGDAPPPALPCPDLSVPPNGRIAGAEWAELRPLGTQMLESMAAQGMTTRRTGLRLPAALVLAERGEELGPALQMIRYYVRAGAFRTLTHDDAALFAVPPDTIIEQRPT